MQNFYYSFTSGKIETDKTLQTILKFLIPIFFCIFSDLKQAECRSVWAFGNVRLGSCPKRESEGLWAF